MATQYSAELTPPSHSAPRHERRYKRLQTAVVFGRRRQHPLTRLGDIVADPLSSQYHTSSFVIFNFPNHSKPLLFNHPHDVLSFIIIYSSSILPFCSITTRRAASVSSCSIGNHYLKSIMKLFFGGGKKPEPVHQQPQTSQINASIHRLRDTISLLEKRGNHLQREAEQCLKNAKAKSTKKDKRGICAGTLLSPLLWLCICTSTT